MESYIIFPFNISSGKLVPGSLEDSIKQSMENLIKFPVNHIPFNRKFGSRVCGLLGEPNDSITASVARFEVLEAIFNNEPRVSLVDARIKYAGSNAGIQVEYIIKSTQQTSQSSFSV